MIRQARLLCLRAVLPGKVKNNFPGQVINSFSMCHKCEHWRPLACLINDSTEKIALIKLNTPMLDEVVCFRKLWNKAVLRACTDGGINRLYLCEDLDRDKYVPDFISGDFDSASKEALSFYREKGAEIVPTPDQDNTDFTKCLKVMLTKIKSLNSPVDSIVAHASHWGRFDHVMGNINTLFLAHQFTSIPLYILSAESVVFLLPKGKHKVHLDPTLRGKHCGLLPVGGPCQSVTTTGLRFNLTNQALKFGDLVSTSNEVISDVHTVTVETDAPLLWTMEINYTALEESSAKPNCVL